MSDERIEIHKPVSEKTENKESASIPKPVPVSIQQTTFPSEVIDLPSEGYFYDLNSPLSSGKIDIKYMTAKEEDILTSQNLIKKGVVIDKLLEALIVTPGVKLDDLLISDKNAILIAIRRLAYGDKYEAEITDPNTGNKYNEIIDLSKLKNKDFDFSKYEKGVNKFNFQTPVGKNNIEYKLLNHKDEKNIEAELKNLSKFGSDSASPEITTRLKYQILSVDGDTDKGKIKHFVDNQLSRDSLALRSNIRDNTPEIDLEYTFTSPETGNTERIMIPFGINFFWPSKEL